MSLDTQTNDHSGSGVCGACRYSMLFAQQPLCSCPLGIRASADHPLALTQPGCELFARRNGKDLRLHSWSLPTGRPSRKNGLHTCGGCRYAVVHAVSPHCDCSLATPGGPHRLSLFQSACAGFQARTGPDLTLHMYSSLRPVEVQEREMESLPIS